MGAFLKTEESMHSERSTARRPTFQPPSHLLLHSEAKDEGLLALAATEAADTGTIICVCQKEGKVAKLSGFICCREMLLVIAGRGNEVPPERIEQMREEAVRALGELASEPLIL